MHRFSLKLSLLIAGVVHYVSGVVRRFYNHRNVADPKRRDDGLVAFLDGYSLGLDYFPVGQPWHRPKAADALWDDFVQVATDTNNVAQRLIKNSKVKTDTDE